MTRKQIFPKQVNEQNKMYLLSKNYADGKIGHCNFKVHRCQIHSIHQ